MQKQLRVSVPYARAASLARLLTVPDALARVVEEAEGEASAKINETAQMSVLDWPNVFVPGFAWIAPQVAMFP